MDTKPKRPAADGKAPQDDAALGDRAQALAKTLHAQMRAETADTLFARGAVLGGTYEVNGLIGRGGMSEVYEARDLQLKRPVALKVALPAIERGLLRQEAEFLAAFRHPGLVTVHAFGVERDLEYLVMERLSGMNLAQHLDRRARRQRGSPFTITETLQILGGVAEALGVLHGAGLAHRDLKPENMMLEPHRRVVLMDFGIMRLERFIDEEKQVCGTPEYMAPESVTSSVQPGNAHLVDIYALGVCAFEILTGRAPFRHENPARVLVKQVKEEPPEVTSFRADVPPSLVRLISEMMAKDPYDRPSSIELVGAELRAIGATERVKKTLAPMSVLIVDDDPDMQEMLRALVLQTAPSAEIRTADDGEQALAEVHARPPEVLFLDLDMPRMNGFEVCMYLRGTSQADRTTIVVVSAHADENQHALERLGVADVIAKKHGDPEAFASAIQTVLTRVERVRTTRFSSQQG